MAKKTAVEETPGYVDVVGALYRKNGGIETKLHVGKNEPATMDSNGEVVKKVRVEFRVTEDKGIQGNQVYSKTVDAVQISDGDTPTATSNPVNPFSTQADGQPTPDPLSKDFKLWTKNTYDKLTDKVDMHSIGIAVAFGLALLSIGLQY